MQEEQKEKKKRQIDNLENLVEKHTRTERHLEQYSEIGEEKYEYSVNFNATQAVNNSDGTQEKNKYRISAKINPDGLITELNMTKILE